MLKNSHPPFDCRRRICQNPFCDVQFAKLKRQLKLLKWAAFHHWLQEFKVAEIEGEGIKVFELASLISAQALHFSLGYPWDIAARFADEPDASPWCPSFSRSAESGMQRRHGSHGVLPGDWSSHSKPHHPHRQLRDPAPGLSHLLHSVRLPWQRPFERVRVGAAGPPATVSHTARGDAKLPGVVPL